MIAQVSLPRSLIGGNSGLPSNDKGRVPKGSPQCTGSGSLARSLIDGLTGRAVVEPNHVCRRRALASHRLAARLCRHHVKWQSCTGACASL